MNILNLRVIKHTVSKSMVLGVGHNYQHFPKRSNLMLGGGVGGIRMPFFVPRNIYFYPYSTVWIRREESMCERRHTSLV